MAHEQKDETKLICVVCGRTTFAWIANSAPDLFWAWSQNWETGECRCELHTRELLGLISG